LECTVPDHGKYKLDVTFKGQKLFPQQVETEITGGGSTSQTLSFELIGDGLHNGRIGENCSFSISVTSAGKPCDIDLGSLQAQCIGKKTTSLKPVRSSAGKYNVNFKVLEAFEHRIVVKYNVDGEWQGVIDQKVHFSDDSFGGYIVKVPTDKVKANSEVKFEIQSVDVLGEKVKTGGDSWQALVAGPEPVNNILITDQRDGTYKCEIKFQYRGTFSVQVVMGEVEAKGSPFKVVVY